MKRFFISFLGIMLCMGCGKDKSNANLKSYLAFFQDRENGYSVVREYGDAMLQVALMPSIFEIVKEHGEVSTLDSLPIWIEPYSGFSYVYLSVVNHGADQNKTSEGQNTGDVFKVDASKIWIDMDGAVIEPIMNHHTSGIDATRYNSVYVFSTSIFDDELSPKKLKNNFQLCYFNPEQSIDTLIFGFDTIRMTTIPNLKL